MSYAEQFVIANSLLPADAILLKKKFAGMFDHFAVYLGRHPQTNEPLFAANYTKGVGIIEPQEANQFLQKLEPEKIERFTGNQEQRRGAIKRAISMKGKRSYHLIFNNCEHYKNFVQFGKKYSKQVDNFGTGALLAGGATAVVGLASKNTKLTIAGLALLALGGIAKSAADHAK
mgnify:CR=1 FL=1